MDVSKRIIDTNYTILGKVLFDYRILMPGQGRRILFLYKTIAIFAGQEYARTVVDKKLKNT